MKRIFSLMTLCGLFALASCQPEDTATVEKDFDFTASLEIARLGETVTFTDNSINVQSRTWTFEDGTPATSGEATVDVVFNSVGTKEITLTVTYSDGTEDKGSLSIEVTNPLSADIAVAGLTKMGAAKFGKEITFSLENVIGNPTSYEWTFPGGTPATSTEASPKVVWNSQIDDVEVSCKITRADDGVEVTATTHIVAGNYPMIKVDTEYGLDVYGFEQGEVNKVWYNWGSFPSDPDYSTTGEHADLMTIVDGGANGTAKCMKLDLARGALTANGSPDCIWEFAARNNWPNNPWLTVGQTYEVSISFKAEKFDLNAGVAAACDWLKVFTFVPDYLNDPLRGLGASTSWSEVFDGDKFEVTSMTELFTKGIWENKQEGQEQGAYDEYLTTDWKTYSYQFTIEPGTIGNEGDVLKNCYVAFGIASIGDIVYVDNIRLDLIEE